MRLAGRDASAAHDVPLLSFAMPDTNVRYLNEAAVAALLPPIQDQVLLTADALSALTDPAGADGPGRSHLPPKMPVVVGRGEAFAHAMPAAVEVKGRRVVGMKWISGDPDRPPPTIGGVILVEDDRHGGLRGIVAASTLTGARTAAVSMVGLRAAPPRTRATDAGAAWRVAFVGGGTQAFSHRAALLRLHPQATVRFVTRRPASDLPLEAGDEAVGPEGLKETVEGADVVITSVAFGTPDREIDAGWLEPGATVVATDYATAVTAETVAGLDASSGRGAAGEDPVLVTDDLGQFDATRAAGKLPGYGPADVSLGTLLQDRDGAGRRMRERPVGRTVVVNHLGVAVADLAFAASVLDAAERSTHPGGAGALLPR